MKYLNKKVDEKRVIFAKNGQKFSKSTTSFFFAKELEAQKSEESNKEEDKEEDKEKIRSYVTSLMNKDTSGHSDSTANSSA